MTEQNIDLLENVVANKAGTRIDWKSTKARIHKWYIDHPSNSIAADALNAGEAIRKIQAFVRKWGSKNVLELLKKEGTLKYN